MCQGGQLYAKSTHIGHVDPECLPPEAPECVEENLRPLNTKTLKSAEECMSFCLGQTVFEDSLTDYHFNWLPDKQCTCIRTVNKFISLSKIRSQFILTFPRLAFCENFQDLPITYLR